MALQIVLFQEVPLPLAVAVVLEGLLHLEMVPPAGQFDAVVAEFLGFFGHVGQGQVGPLAGEQGNGAGHGMLL
ncbi:hypothetical protein D3C83_245990 [compost metagenome]